MEEINELEAVSASDEETDNVVVIVPAQLKKSDEDSGQNKKKKRGGQKKGTGRARTGGMYFAPDAFSDPVTMEAAKDRFTVILSDMNQFFTDQKNIDKYRGEVDGFLSDLPYGNQKENHGQDPSLSETTVTACGNGMFTMGTDAAVAVLGCGNAEQVLLLLLLLCC